MKRYRFIVDFGDASWTVMAGSVRSAAIQAVAERIKNGLHTDLYRVYCSELKIDVYGVKIGVTHD